MAVRPTKSKTVKPEEEKPIAKVYLPYIKGSADKIGTELRNTKLIFYSAPTKGLKTSFPEQKRDST